MSEKKTGVIDIGCPDFERAAENRERIKNKYAIAYWIALERTLAGTPRNKILPKGIPVGELPTVRKRGGGKRPSLDERDDR